MPTFRIPMVCAMALAAGLAVVPSGQAQIRRDSLADSTRGGRMTVAPGPSYGAGPVTRALFGAGWRDLWLTPVSAPVLDLGNYAGGLKVDKRGGGFQTVTLHLSEKDGWREYRFRSVDKYPMLRLSPSLQGTLIGELIQDQTSSLFPAAALLTPPFMEAVGALHVVPTLYVMADDPRLGEHRAMFAGMLGTMELKGEEAPGDKPGFAGSSKVKGTENFFEDLAQSRSHRLNEREMLAVRLVDFLINDGDRTPDNYDWARFGEKGAYLWRPISRDRDRAFTDARGLLNKFFVRRVYPKFTDFGTRYSMRGLTTSSYPFDRRLLQRLTAADFAAVGLEVQRAISDSVIDVAIAALPPEWREQTTEPQRLRSTLIARRAQLPEVSMEFYRRLAGEPDIHLTGDDERAEIVRHPDGRVTVTVPGVARPVVVAPAPDAPSPSGGATRVMNGSLESAAGPAPFYQRTFLPDETNEIRIYLGKGSDTAVVRGAPSDEIIVRVIGGEGNDVLADSAGGGATRLYDAEGDNRFIKSQGTIVSEKPWDAPEQVYGFAPGSAWKPDWGRSAGLRPVVKHMQGAGLVVGVGPRIKQYGFRRLPHRWEAKAAFLVGLGNGRLGLTSEGGFNAENSPLGMSVAARASQLEAFRFYGYGNDTPDIGSTQSLVEQRVVAVEPAVVWNVGWRSRETRGDILRQDSTPTPRTVRPMVGRIKFGPVVAWTDPEPLVGAPLTTSVRGGDSFGELGVKLGVELDATDRDGVPSRGWNLRASFAGYPPELELAPAFGTATAGAATYLPLGNGGAHVALRLGGALASGDFPAQYAPYIGGSSTLRGYRSRRFAGDAAANAGTELRLPVGTLNFLIKSQIGVFALGDVGRVWFDGRSDGGWHTGVGGGVWATALGRVVSVSYAHGEQHRFYLKTGLAF